MSLIPLYPIAASPSLPWTLFKLSHTPTARLAIGYELCYRRRPYRLEDVPRYPAGLSETQRRFQEDEKFAREFRRVPPPGLGEELLDDRLVAGGIVGTRLYILNRPNGLLAPPLGPTIGKNLDVFG